MEDTKKQALLEGIEAIKQDIKHSTSELQTKKQAKAAQAELEPLLNKLKDLKAKLVSSEKEFKDAYPDAAGQGLSKKEAKKAASKAAKKKGTEGTAEPVKEQQSFDNFGVRPLIRSEERTHKVYTNVGELSAAKDGETVFVRARLYTVRGTGNKLAFVVLRQRTATVQAVLEKNDTVSVEMIKFTKGIHRESLVDVEGVVTKAGTEIASCTQKDVELRVTSLFVVSQTLLQELPLLLEDASRPAPILKAQKAQIRKIQAEASAVEAELEQAKKEGKDVTELQAKLEDLSRQKSEAQKFVKVGQKTRLDNRILDLRTSANNAIFRIQSGVCQLFREFLLGQSFTEIHTPKMISAASEGGAGVFKLGYFDGFAYLAQSPQLYKQMAICADFERVFEIGPVFRAENSNTHRHLTEFVGLDLEMAFHEHYHEVLDVLDALFTFLFDGLKNRYAVELEAVRAQYPFEDLKYTSPSPRIEFKEAIALLRELEFTLPSHKTIFDVDIESFEEKLWKYPNVDASDFFNFGLNEETWKDYCKQLEQLRLESTMQSKIRVYESGRTEHDYDPDLPPELAAATGLHDGAVENANSVKSDVGQSDVMKGSGRMRPPMPTGRAIQVEGGYGERLPTIDTRPPRLRDSDAIIEIVLQGAEDDDSSVGIGVQDQSEDGEPQRESFREDLEAGDEPSLEPEYSDGIPQDYNRRKKEHAGRKMPFATSVSSNVANEDESLFVSQDEPIEYSGSRSQNPRSYGGNSSSSQEERKMQKTVRSQSPISPIRKLNTDDNKKEDSVESMEVKDTTLSSSPVIEDVKQSSLEDKDGELEDTGTADGSPRLGKKEIDLNAVDKVDVLKDGIDKKQNLTSQVEQPLLDESDDWEDLKAARSSDNSKARSASSRDNQKRREGLDEEVVQDPRSTRLASIRQHPDENEQGFYRKEHDGKQDPERNHMVLRGRDGSYPYKDRHRSLAHQLHTNTDGFDRQKDRDSSDMDWARRDDDVYSRKVRTNEPRKRDRAKLRENERNDKEDSFHSRKQLDNGSYRIPYEKDAGSRDSRHRERDEGVRVRYEAVEDYHIKRRKDEEYLRREHMDKEEIPHGYRENASRRRRERDEVQRSRDYPDDQYTNRQKDDAWLMQERGDRQRDREEWHRLKLSHDGPLPKREREEGRSSGRNVRGAEEKAWVGRDSAKDEHKLSEKDYQSRESVRHNDQLKRRDRIPEESSHHKGRDDAYGRGNQYTAEERRSRQERSSSRSDRVANASDNQRLHERKHKEGSRKSKERDISDQNSLGLSKKSLENPNGPSNEKGLKESGDQERAEHEIPGHRLSRKHQDGISSDDEQQDSYRGRSKLERWTSHKERDFSINKPSSSLKFKDSDKKNNGGSSEAGKPVDESAKTVDLDNQQPLMPEARDSVDTESRDGDSKESGDRHLDTVERLKKRSERFKLPMPSEKETLVIKKLETEPLPSAKTENPVESEVKQERPPRKRRWISN